MPEPQPYDQLVKEGYKFVRYPNNAIALYPVHSHAVGLVNYYRKKGRSAYVVTINKGPHGEKHPDKYVVLWKERGRKYN
jgi:hypothetical protein